MNFKELWNGIVNQVSNDANSRLDDDEHYTQAFLETQEGHMDTAALARATEEAGGDSEKTKSLYVKHRVRRLRDIAELRKADVARASAEALIAALASKKRFDTTASPVLIDAAGRQRTLTRTTDGKLEAETVFGGKKYFSSISEAEEYFNGKQTSPNAKSLENETTLREEKNSEGNLTDAGKKTTEMILDTVRLQLGSTKPDERKFTSDFVKGYLIGYTDAAMQRMSIDNNSVEGLSILTIVFVDFYGPDNGSNFLGNFFKEQDHLTEDFKDGMKKGGADIFEWLAQDGRKQPNGLRQFFLQHN